MSACLYLHGFLSSPQSQKAQQLSAYYQQQLADHTLVIPQLPFAPKEAIAVAEQALLKLQQAHEQVYLIGSSLGGFYATYLNQKHSSSDQSVPAVLINPAVRPFELFQHYLGEHKHYYSDEVHTLEPEHLQQLQDLYVPQLSAPEQLLLLLQTADETLDYRHAADYYRACPAWLEGGGDHSFQQFIERMPMVLEFARQRWASSGD